MGRQNTHSYQLGVVVNIELEDVHKYVPTNVAADEMNWDAYAEHYDQMCKFNTSYQENIKILQDLVASWPLPADAQICDLGAGTGNYITSLAKTCPEARFVHVDFDEKMNDAAFRKYQEAGIQNIQLVTEYVQDCEFPDNSFDLILCINALYAISPQENVLKKVKRWLKPDGRFFVIDFGRKQRTLDWTIYLFRESMKNHQAGEYVKALINSREVLKQNRKTSQGQSTGRYWLHSTTEFGDALRACGFSVEELYACYRGYADLAICRKSE